MPLSFPEIAEFAWGVGQPQLVCSRRPRRLGLVYMELNLLATGGSGGTRADQGVCPTSSVQLSDIAHYYLPWLSLRK